MLAGYHASSAYQMKATGQQGAQREFLQRREQDAFDALNLREHDQRFQSFQNSAAGNCSDIFFLNCGDKSPQMADALGSLCASLSGKSMWLDVSLCDTALEAQDPGSKFASAWASGEWQIGSTPLSSGAWHLIETPKANIDHALEPNSSKSDISPSDDGEAASADAHIPDTSYLVGSDDVPSGSATSYSSYNDESSVHSADAADIPETSYLLSSAQRFDSACQKSVARVKMIPDGLMQHAMPSVETGTCVLMQVKPRLLRRNAGPGSKHSLGGRPHFVDDDDLRPLFITPEMLRACFGLPLHEAARKLGICATAVKKCCRKLGIRNWPFQRLRPIQARLAKLQASPFVTESIEREIRFLHDQVKDLLEGRELKCLKQERHMQMSVQSASTTNLVEDSRNGPQTG